MKNFLTTVFGLLFGASLLISSVQFAAATSDTETVQATEEAFSEKDAPYSDNMGSEEGSDEGLNDDNEATDSDTDDEAQETPPEESRE